jgi:hypothetical protein
MALFTTTLDLYGGVLWSGELQGFIIHQMTPSSVAHHLAALPTQVLVLLQPPPLFAQWSLAVAECGIGIRPAINAKPLALPRIHGA